MDPSSSAEEHCPDNNYNYLPKAIASTSLSYILAFLGDVTHHQNHYALLLDRVQEDVRYWLTCRRYDRRPVLLNREEQTEDEEPAEERRNSDRLDDVNWSRNGRFVCLLGHMRARLKSSRSNRKQTSFGDACI